MKNVIFCIVYLAIGNFGYQAMKDIPIYMDATHATWSQACALILYYFLWGRHAPKKSTTS